MMTIEEIIAQELTPRTVRFWGNDYEDFHPELLEKVFGDGQRLMFFTPLNTRPYYYIARIDSQSPNLENEDEVNDFIDDLIEALEDCFGYVRDRDDEDPDDAGDDRGWPVLSIDTGFTWGFYDENGNVI